MRPSAAAIFTVGFLFSASASADLLSLSAGPHDRRGSIVSVALPEDWKAGCPVRLTETDGERDIPAQVVGGQPPQLVWRLANVLPAGKSRSYRLERRRDAPSDAVRHVVNVEQDTRRLRVVAGGRPVLEYNIATVEPVGGKHPEFARSGFIHPVYSPAGQVISDSMPPDHMHQQGIMFPWRKTKFEGREVNFWEVQHGSGRVEHAAVESVESGPVCGQFVVRKKHVDRRAPAGPKTVLEETWRVAVYHFGEVFLFDIVSTQTCATDSPLSIEKYHYGGFALRGRREWIGDDRAGFLTAEGRDRKSGNAQPTRWVEMFGPLDGKATGITVFGHPANFRAPQTVRLHPVKPYFCFAPGADGKFNIEPGKPYISRYRCLVHAGKLDPAVAERHWRDYADPPMVRIVGE